MSRTHARGIVGEALSYAFDNATLGFALAANASAPAIAGVAVRAGPPHFVSVAAAEYEPAMARRRGVLGDAAAVMTEVYVPPTLASFKVAAAGAAALSEVTTWPDGARTAYVLPSGGVYAVSVAATAAEAEALAQNALGQHAGGGGGGGGGGQVDAAAVAAQRSRVLAAIEARFDDARAAARLVGIEL